MINSKFDTTKTDQQFDNYYDITKPRLSDLDKAYNTEKTNITNIRTPIAQDQSKNVSNLKTSDKYITDHTNTKNHYNNVSAQYHSWANRRGPWYDRGRYRRRYRGPAYAFSAAAGRELTLINTENPKNTVLKQTGNKLDVKIQSVNDDLTAIKTKINDNNTKRSTLIEQKSFYDNREQACKDTKTLINEQETLLAQYKSELDVLEKNHKECTKKYDEKCSRKQRDALGTMITDRDKQIQLVENKQTEYKSVCNNSSINCDKQYADFKSINEEYTKESTYKNDLKNRHDICVDPTRNDCKDIYNKYQQSKSNTQIATSVVEKLQNFDDDDAAYETHSKITANYKTVQSDYNKLESNIQELNDKLNKKNSIYASSQHKYDKTIYANILLTTVATTLIYYVFVDM